MGVMKRRDFLGQMTAGGMLAFGAGANQRPAAAQSRTLPHRPNVILVMTDDQGYGDLGCHGNRDIRTPNIDRFYQESARFNHFFVSPTCSPTRAGLLTGRHEFRCGISHTILGRSLLREDEVTIADVLSGAGYRTGIFGKWHLGDNYPCRPMDRGFQECFYHGGGGIGQTPDFWGTSYFNPVINHNGTCKRTRGYCTDVFFNAALNWIGRNRDLPFFAYITPNAPHTPLDVPESFARSYQERGLGPDAAKFYGMIANIDQNIGRLVMRIRDMGLEENTLIIFLTDNGSAQACRLGLHNGGMRGCKGTAHEGGVRVPCFFRWPGKLETGRDIASIAAHVDILPTLAALCGASLPRDRKLDGVSLLPLLAGERDELPDRHLITHVGRWPADVDPRDCKYERCSVRSQRFRLIENRELYDMENDPGETVNVIDRFPEAVAQMRQSYDRWWDEVLPVLRSTQHIKLGAPEENPLTLSCMDWGSSMVSPGDPDWRKVPFWKQDCLASLAVGKTYLMDSTPAKQGTMGSWAVEFTRSGRYLMTLRKLPSQALEAANALNDGTAHIVCGNTRYYERIAPGATSVSFELDCTPGTARLECWFTGQREDGNPSGAYFVDVHFLG